VIQTNPGICCGEIAGDVNWVGGMTYADWLRGKRFETGMEMRAHTCPAWWYQCADYTKKPDWKECWSANMFSACKYFGDKHKCWERWDKEFRNKQ
jgi:hypothetical protein